MDKLKVYWQMAKGFVTAYWWLILGILIFLAGWLLRGSKREVPDFLNRAKEAIDRARERMEWKLKAHRAEMDQRRKELKEISTIPDEAERLRRLADLANRRRR